MVQKSWIVAIIGILLICSIIIATVNGKDIQVRRRIQRRVRRLEDLCDDIDKLQRK